MNIYNSADDAVKAGFLNLKRVSITFDKDQHSELLCNIECTLDNVETLISDIAEQQGRLVDKKVSSIMADILFVC